MSVCSDSPQMGSEKRKKQNKTQTAPSNASKLKNLCANDIYDPFKSRKMNILS